MININETISIEVSDCNLNPNDFISYYSDDSCTLYNKIEINNKYYFNNQRIFNKNNLAYESVLTVIYIKGFINNTCNLDFTVKARTYGEKVETIPVCYNNKNQTVFSDKLRFKDTCFDDIKKALEFNKISYESKLTVDGYFIDLFVSYKNYKIVFILTYNLDSFNKLIDFCIVNNYQIVIINFLKNLDIDEEVATVIDYHTDTYYRAMKVKENSFFQVIQNFIIKSCTYPFQEIDNISIEHFYTREGNELRFNEYAIPNVIFDKNVFSSYPVIDIKDIKREIWFKCFYKHGFMKYEFSLLLETI